MENPLRALMVEDSPSDTELVLRQLRRSGYAPVHRRVETAETMRAALEQEHWDIVISDASMPCFDASSALASLKATGLDIPFIVVSGTIGEESAVALMKDGATDYVMKGRLPLLGPAVARALKEADARRRQRRAEEALRQSERRYRELIQYANSAIIRVKHDGTLTFFNDYAQTFFGYREDEVIGRPVSMLVPETEAGGRSLRSLVEDVIGEPQRYAQHINENICRDGRRVWMTWSNTPILDASGKVVEFLSVGSDITERVLAEEEISRKNKILAGMNRILNQVLKFETDEELGQACLAEAKEITQSRIGFLGLINEKGNLDDIAISNGDWETFRIIDRNEHRQPLPGKAASYGLCGRILIDGEGFFSNNPGSHPDWIGPPDRHPPLDAFLGAPLRNNGRIIGLVAVGNRPGGYRPRDLEALENLAPVIAAAFMRRQAEEERKKSEALLFQAQKMEAVGRLAGGIAHDFNNLLSVILGYGELLLLDSAQDHPSFEPLQEIHKAAERAKKLTYQLMAFSRKQVLETHDIDASRLIVDFERMIRRVLGEDIEIALKFSPAAVHVKADRVQLEQVLMNLVVNARDAMPDGGRLIIETAMVDLDEKYTASRPNMDPGQYGMIAVSDTGMGIPAEHLSRIFEPFFTTKDVDKGTGLGLATSYGIVKQHGGNIWVYSEPGRGTTFKIYLPLVPGRAEKPVYVETCAVAASQAATILMVEDDPSVRKLTHTILNAKGYCVLSSGIAQDAIELAGAHEEPIHLLLTDVIMPNMKGPEVYQRIAEHHPGIKVVYMSGYTENVIAHQGVLEEGVYFIQKPFSANDLVAKINAALSEGYEKELEHVG